MHVRILGRDKVEIFDSKRRVLRCQSVAPDFARVVLSRKKVVAHLGWEVAASITLDPAEGDGGEQRERRKLCVGLQARLEWRCRTKRELAALEDLNQGVAIDPFGALIPVQSATDAAVREERDFDEVFEPMGDSFDLRPVRSATTQSSGATPGVGAIVTAQIIAVRAAHRDVQ